MYLKQILLNLKIAGDKQKELLKQYYEANKFLVDCLNTDCYVSREVRKQIKDTLLLPIAKIKKIAKRSRPGNSYYLFAKNS
ncbi:NACHT domain family protein [Nostoc linckia NIES-25]|nr:NACHT domain family protein [Nostoc linckia NIES-25]